jgi:hypothetical protein
VKTFGLLRRKDVVGLDRHYTWFDLIWQRVMLAMMFVVVVAFIYHLSSGHPIWREWLTSERVNVGTPIGVP